MWCGGRTVIRSDRLKSGLCYQDTWATWSIWERTTSISVIWNCRFFFFIFWSSLSLYVLISSSDAAWSYHQLSLSLLSIFRLGFIIIISCRVLLVCSSVLESVSVCPRCALLLVTARRPSQRRAAMIESNIVFVRISVEQAIHNRTTRKQQ